MWHHCSSMNSVLTLMLCLNHPPSLCSRTRRYLQITSGNQRKNSNGTLAEMSSLSLMAVLYSIECHGHHSTYESVSHLYVRYVTQKYGAATIVFDGYNDDPTTKDAKHLRRTGDCVGVTVHVASGMMIKFEKDEFLNNKANKQRFIHYLSDNLETAGCSVDHAKDDADVLIVLTAVASVRHKDTVLIGDDTYLLVLVLHHVEIDAREVFLKSEPNKSTQQVTWFGCVWSHSLHPCNPWLWCNLSPVWTRERFGSKRIKSDFQLCQ